MAACVDQVLYGVARLLVAVIQSFPLTWVARFGQVTGGLAYYLDARHRRVAIENLTRCFGSEMRPQAIRRLARLNFQRIGENFAAAIKTASMSWPELRPHLTCSGVDKIVPADRSQPFANRLMAIGHFGNFELYARFGQIEPGYQCATTYRKLRQPSLNHLLQSLRKRSGCLYFERCEEGAALKAILMRTGFMLGLLCDQHAGDRGLPVPFFGQESSTISAPALFALRYNMHLHTAICHRTRLAHWRIELGDEIQVREQGRPRSPEAIMQDVNRAFEDAIRQDPANWFWVHRRWKTVHRKKRPASRNTTECPDPPGAAH